MDRRAKKRQEEDYNEEEEECTRQVHFNIFLLYMLFLVVYVISWCKYYFVYVSNVPIIMYLIIVHMNCI